jgi:hypothetical protein
MDRTQTLSGRQTFPDAGRPRPSASRRLTSDRVLVRRAGKCMGITCATGCPHPCFRQGWEVFAETVPWKDRHPPHGLECRGARRCREEYDEAAHRELHEELGVSAKLSVLKLEASERTGQEFIWLYRTVHEGPFSLAPAEIDYGAFFPANLVTAWIRARPEEFAPGFIECWRNYLQQFDETLR